MPVPAHRAHGVLESAELESLFTATQNLGVSKFICNRAKQSFVESIEDADTRPGAERYQSLGFTAIRSVQPSLFAIPSIADDIEPRGRTIYDVHFTPYVREGKDRQLHWIVEPYEEQKNVIMTQGLYGTLGFISAVESGLLTRPTALIGDTNPVMARFARRVGFKSIGDFVASAEPEPTPYTKEETMDYLEHLLDKINRKHTDTSAYEKLLRAARSLHAKGEVDKAHGFLGVASRLVELPVKDQYIFTDFETFRERILGITKKFARRVAKLGLRELERVGK